MPYTRDSGATKIQAVWRGYKTRASLVKAPSTAHPIHYQTFVTGNEPRELLENRHKVNGHFVFVGTSGLTNLHWIKQVAGGPIVSPDNFTGIPKLFVVDLSRSVERFWITFKTMMAKSRNFDEFQRNVSISRDTFRYCCSNPKGKGAMGYDIADEIIDNIKKLSQDPQGKVSEEWFIFFRNVVCKASIICEDWSNPVTFQYIKNMTDGKVPVVVYASNILEYVGNAFGARTHDPNGLVGDIIKNIELLNPVLAIHTRTLAAKSAKHSTPDRVAIQPDRVVLLDKNQMANNHLGILNNPEYVRMVKETRAKVQTVPDVVAMANALVAELTPEELMLLMIRQRGKRFALDEDEDEVDNKISNQCKCN